MKQPIKVSPQFMAYWGQGGRWNDPRVKDGKFYRKEGKDKKYFSLCGQRLGKINPSGVTTCLSCLKAMHRQPVADSQAMNSLPIVDVHVQPDSSPLNAFPAKESKT